MHRNEFMISLAFGAMLLTAYEASAQTRNCAPRDTVVERLADRYNESRQVLALNGANLVLEVFASEESGTWTITLTQHSGLTCIVAAGENYQYVAELPTQPQEDA